jgi:NACalpha-BTF3-like transcription factor
MYDALKPTDETEIRAMMRSGYTQHDAVLSLFQRSVGQNSGSVSGHGRGSKSSNQNSSHRNTNMEQPIMVTAVVAQPYSLDSNKSNRVITSTGKVSKGGPRKGHNINSSSSYDDDDDNDNQSVTSSVRSRVMIDGGSSESVCSKKSTSRFSMLGFGTRTDSNDNDDSNDGNISVSTNRNSISARSKSSNVDTTRSSIVKKKSLSFLDNFSLPSSRKNNSNDNNAFGVKYKEKDVKFITDMGYSREQAVWALIAQKGNLAAAIDDLANTWNQAATAIIIIIIIIYCYNCKY